jgi:hypothetical protein
MQKFIILDTQMNTEHENGNTDMRFRHLLVMR